jgi:hypothetical protein
VDREHRILSASGRIHSKSALIPENCSRSLAELFPFLNNSPGMVLPRCLAWNTSLCWLVIVRRTCSDSAFWFAQGSGSRVLPGTKKRSLFVSSRKVNCASNWLAGLPGQIHTRGTDGASSGGPPRERVCYQTAKYYEIVAWSSICTQ